MSEFDDKYESLLTATRERPQDGLAWAALARFLLDETLNANRAVRAYQKAQELSPDHDFRSLLSLAMFEAGRDEEAIELARESAVQNPRPQAEVILADHFYRSERYPEAIEAAQRAIALDPEFQEAHYHLGRAQLESDVPLALKSLRESIRLDPEYGPAWQFLGIALQKIGQHAEAISSMERATGLQPDDPWSFAILASMLADVDKVRARNAWVRAVELTEGDPEFKAWLDRFDLEHPQ